MAGKTHPTTIRLSDEDQSFLASLQVAGASTISDKIRALIAERRLQQEAHRDYKAALLLAGSLLEPVQEGVRIAEKEHRVHSQLLRRTLDWLPELLATLLAERPTDELPSRKELESLEDTVGEHLLRLVDFLLQAWLARDSALYSAEVLNAKRFAVLKRLCRLVDEEDDN